MAKVIKNLAPTHETICLGADMPTQQAIVAEQMLYSEHERLLQESYQSGLAAGLQQASDKMQESWQTLANLINTIPQAISANRMQLNQEIADIVLMIVQQFFINQQISPEAISAQINQILAELNEKQQIDLLLHPGDIALLQQGALDLTSHAHRNLRILPSEELALGGCLVRSEHGLFDAGVERQIDSLKQVLLQIKQGNAHV